MILHGSLGGLFAMFHRRPVSPILPTLPSKTLPGLKTRSVSYPDGILARHRCYNLLGSLRPRISRRRRLRRDSAGAERLSPGFTVCPDSRWHLLRRRRRGCLDWRKAILNLRASINRPVPNYFARSFSRVIKLLRQLTPAVATVL
jgi:hypothetical protein